MPEFVHLYNKAFMVFRNILLENNPPCDRHTNFIHRYMFRQIVTAQASMN